MHRHLRSLGLFSLTLSTLAGSAPAQAAPNWNSSLKLESGFEASPEMIEESLSSQLFTTPLPTTPAFNEATAGKVQVLTYRKPKDFQYEFSVLVVEGKIRRVFLVSTAINGKTPILGIHRLTALKQKGLPWPWITSNKYGNSPMYWGVNIRGGYYIHSSPHYGNLGRPASMGCVRTSIPDAMEVFNTVANEYADYPSYSMIYEGFTLATDTPEARFLKTVLANSGMSVDDLKNALLKSKQEIMAVSHGDLFFAPNVPVDAHARAFTGEQSDERLFPRCAGANCWDVFHKTRKILPISAEAMRVR